MYVSRIKRVLRGKVPLVFSLLPLVVGVVGKREHMMKPMNGISAFEDFGDSVWHKASQ